MMVSAMVLVAVMALVSVMATGAVQVTNRRYRPNPWNAPGFAEWFAGWVAESTADHQAPGPAAAELELVVAELTRPFAPPRLRLQAA